MDFSGRTLVIGGHGAVGTGIVDTLLAAQMPVDVLDLSPSSIERAGVGFIEGDIRDADVLGRVGGYGKIVVSFGRLGRGLAEQPADGWLLNLDATMRVIAAARTGHCRRFVFLSSAMVYDRGGSTGQLSGSIAEDAPLRGRCLYTHSKLAIEHALACAVAAGLAPTLILRPFTVFGRGPLRGEAGHLVGRWLELARAGQALTVQGDGSQTVDLVPSSVLGAACVRFLSEQDPPPLRVLNGTCGRPMTIRSLADLFAVHFPGLGIESMPIPASTVPPSQTWGDPTALRRYLGADLPDPIESMHAFLGDHSCSR
jgi:UDP-glucose 4-epimerase